MNHWEVLDHTVSPVGEEIQVCPGCGRTGRVVETWSQGKLIQTRYIHREQARDRHGMEPLDECGTVMMCEDLQSYHILPHLADSARSID